MRKYAAVLGATALLISAGIAAAQSQTPRNYDSSGAPKSGSEQPRRSYAGEWVTMSVRRRGEPAF
jgi:hypothetical protein